MQAKLSPPVPPVLLPINVQPPALPIGGIILHHKGNLLELPASVAAPWLAVAPVDIPKEQKYVEVLMACLQLYNKRYSNRRAQDASLVFHNPARGGIA